MKTNLLYRILSMIFILFVCADILLPQSANIKLPTNDHSSSFDITQNGGTNIFRVFGDAGFYAGGTFGIGSIPITGEGIRLMWYLKKAAFRAGYADVNRWKDANVGNYSVAMGYNGQAAGQYSVAMGNNSTTVGDGAISLGMSIEASGDGAMAFGSEAFSDAAGCLAIGDNSTINLLYSTTNNRFVMRFAGGYILYSSSNLSNYVYVNPGENS